MPREPQYVPILKGKQGEFGALLHVSETDRQLITPLIEIPPIPWNHTNNCPSKTIDQHLAKTDTALANCWDTQNTFFLDFLWISEAERLSDGSHPMEDLFRRLRDRQMKAVPVINLVRGDDYRLACRNIITLDQAGICIRLQREDFDPQNDVVEQLYELLDTLGISMFQADLILDLGCLASEGGACTSDEISSLTRAIPDITEWRSFAVAGTGFPVDLMGMPPEEVSRVARLEWTLWRAVRGRNGLPRLPIYADYGIAHPQPPEVDPRIMRPSASIRYTAEDSWLVLKGRNLRDHGFQQFHDVSRFLVQSAEYVGAKFSWGDQYIQRCSSNLCGPGNLTTWRMVGTSHHIAYVLNQISNIS